MEPRAILKLIAPAFFAGVLVSIVTTVSLETLGFALKYLVLGVAILVGIAYGVLGILVFIYRGLTWVANIAWGDVFEKHNDDTQTVTKDDIPSRRRIYVAWAALQTKEFLTFTGNRVAFDEYHTKMTASLGDDTDAS